MTDRQALIQQIQHLVVPPGSLALWGLGQSGFVIKGGSTIVCIDPYLTNSIEERPTATGLFERAFPPPLLPEDIAFADIIFCTHEHGDHTDLPTVVPMSKASPQAPFVGPTNSRDMMVDAGIPAERIFVPAVGQAHTIGNVRFTATPAAHYGLDYDEQHGYRWLGFVIELNGVTLYHSGDSILFDGLIEAVKQHTLDIACLPVNGRDWWREQKDIIGNFNMDEAVQLVNVIQPDVFIPMHNDMFAQNRVNPGILADYIDRHAPRQKYHWIQPGELYFYVKRPGG